MLKFSQFLLLALAALVAYAPSPACAEPQSNSGKVPVTTVVTVLGPNYTAPPALGKSDVVVRTGKEREDITAWVPAQGDKAKLELAIFIDDGADINTQLSDLRKFIQQLPKGASVGLFYSQNGITQTVSPFSTDLNEAARKLRITEGATSTSMSMYISVMDFMSKWPATGARREIFMICDGIDRYRGDPNSPDVIATIEKAEKAGIIIHSLYAKDVDRAGRNSFRSNWGQSNLAQITDATGGESFFQGLDTPVSFTPFLEQLDMVLHNQYYLTFTTPSSDKKKGELRGFHITTEQHNVEISSPRELLVPGQPK